MEQAREVVGCLFYGVVGGVGGGGGMCRVVIVLWGEGRGGWQGW